MAIKHPTQDELLTTSDKVTHNKALAFNDMVTIKRFNALQNGSFYSPENATSHDSVTKDDKVLFLYYLFMQRQQRNR